VFLAISSFKKKKNEISSTDTFSGSFLLSIFVDDFSINSKLQEEIAKNGSHSFSAVLGDGHCIRPL